MKRDKVEEFKELAEIVEIMNNENVGLRNFIKLYSGSELNERFPQIFGELDVHENTYSTINYKLRNFGFMPHKKRWIHRADLEFESLINGMDIEEKVGIEAGKRYYNSYAAEDLTGEFIEISFHKELLEEYIELSEENNCENNSSYLYLVLLEHLNKVKKVDREREFEIRFLKENFNDEDIEFVLNYEKQGYSFNALYNYILADGVPVIEEFKAYMLNRGK